MLEIEPTAYPIAGGEISMPFVNEKGGTEIKTVQIRQQFGMTKREYMATKIMAAMFSTDSFEHTTDFQMFARDRAIKAVLVAEELIKQLDRLKDAK